MQHGLPHSYPRGKWHRQIDIAAPNNGRLPTVRGDNLQTHLTQAGKVFTALGRPAPVRQDTD